MSFQDSADELMDECASQLGDAVTYRRRVQGAFDGATGKMMPTANSDTPCNAIRGPSRIVMSDVGTPVEEIEWTFRASDLPAGRAAGDVVLDDAGVEHVVKDLPQDESATKAVKVTTRTTR